MKVLCCLGANTKEVRGPLYSHRSLKSDISARTGHNLIHHTICSWALRYLHRNRSDSALVNHSPDQKKKGKERFNTRYYFGLACSTIIPPTMASMQHQIHKDYCRYSSQNVFCLMLICHLTIIWQLYLNKITALHNTVMETTLKYSQIARSYHFNSTRYQL